MATTGILRSRRSVAQLHAIESVEREIRANDSAGGRKYLRDFHDAYRGYQNILSAGQVRDKIAAAGIVLIGDYHALPNSQRYVASLLRDPVLHRRPVVLGVETIFARDQHIVDEWLGGEIDEDELRQRMRFDLDWGYEWAPFYELLSAARDHQTPIYGLDCMPREDLRKIAARDRHAADKIAEIRASHPDALLLVLFGESHLAPQHLPALVAKRISKEAPEAASPKTRLLTVLQNVDALYWRAAGEPSDHIDAVEVNPDVLCVFNATPLEKYENYRICLDRWGRDDDGSPDLGPTYYNLIDGMVRFLGINQYSPHNSTQPRLLVDLMPEVYSRGSDAHLRRLLSRKGFTDAERRSLPRRIRERGSVYLEPLNMIYVQDFRMASSAEDATRFLHHACRALPNRTGRKTADLSTEDIFYTSVLEHALASLGSRVLHPARPAFRDADLAELYDCTREDVEQQTSLPFADAVNALDFVTRHRSFERDLKRDRSASVQNHPGALNFSDDKHEFITQTLGYLAGSDLYDAYVRGRVTPAVLRKLFLKHIDEPGVARETYFQVTSPPK